MKKVYPVILTKVENGYVVYVPDLDINTEGCDVADAIAMARDAIGMWGICQQDLNKDIPEPTNLDPAHESGTLVALVDIDFDQYRKAHDMRTERINVSVQAYLLDEARRQKLNVSGVLQEALKDRLGL